MDDAAACPLLQTRNLSKTCSASRHGRHTRLHSTASPLRSSCKQSASGRMRGGIPDIRSGFSRRESPSRTGPGLLRGNFRHAATLHPACTVRWAAVAMTEANTQRSSSESLRSSRNPFHGQRGVHTRKLAFWDLGYCNAKFDVKNAQP